MKFKHLSVYYDRAGVARKEPLRVSLEDLASSGYTISLCQQKAPYDSPIRGDLPCLFISRAPKVKVEDDPWYDGDKRVPTLLTMLYIPHLSMYEGVVEAVGLERPNLMHAGEILPSRDTDGSPSRDVLTIQQVRLW